jgi:hypothetical protein
MEKITLYFTVNHQDLSVNHSEIQLVANSVGYVQAKIDFSEDWTGLYKVAVFENQKSYYAINIDEEDLNEDGTFDIPYSVLKVPGFKVSCFGTSTKMSINLSGQIVSPQIRKRITTDVVSIGLKISGPLQGVTPSVTSKELNVYEISELALKIAKEAYSTAWNMQYSLKEINELLGGDPYALYRVESTIQEILKTVNGTQIKKDQFGVPQFDEEGNYIFEEVEE